jgi:hypothetical protein
VAVAAGLATAVLAGSSTGSLVLAALLIGVAATDRRAAGAALLAVAATAIRFRTASFDDLAGIQSVLGPAGTVGPTTAAASAWAAAAAVVLSARTPVALTPAPGAGRAAAILRRLPALAPALACGLLAAALVAGPGPSDLRLRIGASVVAVVVALGVAVASSRPRSERLVPWVALLAGVVAVVLAGWPS